MAHNDPITHTHTHSIVEGGVETDGQVFGICVVPSNMCVAANRLSINSIARALY